MRKLSYIAQVNSGKLDIQPAVRARMESDVNKLKEGRYIEIKLVPMPKRSLNQNAFYHAVCIPMVQSGLQDIGYDFDLDQTHEFLKLKFNSEKIVTEHGEVIGERGGSTTEMNITDFMDYLERITLFAAEYLNVIIPPPHSQTSIDFK